MSLELREIIKRECVPYPDKEKLFMVLGLLLGGGYLWVRQPSSSV